MITVRTKRGQTFNLSPQSRISAGDVSVELSEIEEVVCEEGELGLLDGERMGKTIRALRFTDVVTEVPWFLIMDPEASYQLADMMARRRIEIARSFPAGL